MIPKKFFFSQKVVFCIKKNFLKKKIFFKKTGLEDRRVRSWGRETATKPFPDRYLVTGNGVIFPLPVTRELVATPLPVTRELVTAPLPVTRELVTEELPVTWERNGNFPPLVLKSLEVT